MLALGAWAGAARAADAARLTPDTALTAGVELPAPPPWPVPQAELRSSAALEAALRAACGGSPQLIHQADRFVLPDVAWLTAYTRWFERLRKPLHIEYEEQTFDCDKFARCFVAFADLLARKGGERRASIGVGWTTVQADAAFAGVSGGGHALVIAATTSGLYIIEPQNGTMTPLERYPNRAQLQQVNF